MIATFLFLGLVQVPATAHWNSPDPMSTFRFLGRASAGVGAVDIESAIHLAHQMWSRANVPDYRSLNNYDNNVSRTDDTNVSVDYRSKVGISYRLSTGRLFAFTVAPPKDMNRAPNLSLEACVESARDWYRLAGGHEPLSVERAYLAKNEPNEAYIHFVFTAPGTSYSLGAGVETYIDRTYGTPDGMWIGVPPAFDRPSHVIQKDGATANAIAAAIEFTGWNVVEGGSQEPAFHIPDYANLPNRLGDAHRQRIRDRKACLIYEVTVQDGSVPETGVLRPFVQVYVDAETGDPIGLLPAYLQMGGKTLARRPFAWGGEPWQVGRTKGKVSPASEPAAPRGRKAILSQGRSRVIATFDRRTGLLWAGQGESAVVGRPEPKLARALAGAKPPPRFPMRKP